MHIVMNKINCTLEVIEKIKEMFNNRAHAIDHMEGFEGMWVLQSEENPQQILVITQWKSKEHFKLWVQSPAFIEGHKRGFALMAESKEKILDSKIEHYQVVTR